MDVENLLEYQKWANSQIIDVVKEVKENDLVKPLQNTRSLKELLVHFVNSYDYMWLPFEKFEERLNELATLDINRLTEALITSTNKFVDKSLKLEGKQEMSIGEKKVALDRDNFLLVYTDHLTYHRGQITTALKLLGYNGVNTDYYTFLGS